MKSRWKPQKTKEQIKQEKIAQMKAKNNKAPIATPQYVVDFEAAHQLPRLIGTSKQISYGRRCRYDYLSQVNDFYRELSPDDQVSIVDYLKNLKPTASANHWINTKGELLRANWLLHVDRIKDRIESRKAERFTKPVNAYDNLWKLKISEAYLQKGLI